MTNRTIGNHTFSASESDWHCGAI